MALTEADRERARELAAAAPPPSPELVTRLRAILAGCVPAKSPAAAVVSMEPAAPDDPRLWDRREAG